jgi:hypothetical protein
MSPLAFATFGMLCIKWFPTPDAAFRYGELGLELLDMFQVREYLPRVYAAYYACIFQWRYHLPDSLDHLKKAQRVGMQTGDVEFACLCANLWGYIAMDTDIPLDEIENHWTSFQTTMKSRRQKSILRMSVTCLQAIQYLQGKDVDFAVTKQLLQYSIDNHIASTRNGIHWSEAKTAYLFNNLFRADEIAFDVCFSKYVHTLPPTCEIVQIAFLNGMIALAMATQKRNDCKFRPKRTRKQYIAEGKHMLYGHQSILLTSSFYSRQNLPLWKADMIKLCSTLSVRSRCRKSVAIFLYKVCPMNVLADIAFQY